MAEKTKQYDQVLVLMSTTNIDRVTTIQRVANRTGKTVIHDILLSNVLTLVTQKIPNALNSKKVQVFLPSFIYLLKDRPEYQQYIEPFKEKMKYTGRALHGKFIMNIRISMLRDIIKLKEKSKVLDNCCCCYSLWSGYKTQDEPTIKFLEKITELGIPIIDLHTSRTPETEIVLNKL